MDEDVSLSPRLTRPRWPWILSAIGLVLATGTWYVAVYERSPSSSESSSIPRGDAAVSDTLTAQPTTCPYPVVEKPEQAFAYGVPDGWIHEADGETVSIMEDDSNTTAAFVYTAKLERSLSPTEFLSAVGEVFRTSIEDAGGTFTLAAASQSGNRVTAIAQATVEEGNLSGRFETAIESGFATFTAYWAPTSELVSKESMLQEVVGCFARTTTLTDATLAGAGTKTSSPAAAASTPATNYQGAYFNVYLPTGWQVTAETDSGIDTANAEGSAGFSYAYATGTSSAIEQASWASERLGLVGVSSASLGAASDVSVEIANYTVKAFPFSGTFAGRSVAGEITVGVYNTPDFGLGSYGSAFWGIQIAQSGLWPSVSATTQDMQDSLFTKDLGATRKSVTLPTGTSIDDAGGSAITSGYEYRSQLGAKSKDNWAAGMRGYETYQSPSTGDAYDVPINAYDPTGPDGPGYYRQLPGTGGLEKLEPVN